MTQESVKTMPRGEPPQPTEAQVKGAAIKSFLIEILREAFSVLPGYLEDGAYVDEVGHSSPQRRAGIVIAKEEVEGSSTGYFSRIHELVVLNHEGIFRIRYVQKNASQPIVPSGMKDIPLEEYPNYKQRALEAIWSTPHFPKPQVNP